MYHLFLFEMFLKLYVFYRCCLPALLIGGSRAFKPGFHRFFWCLSHLVFVISAGGKQLAI